ncbi:MAG: TolC family protein [Flavobacteriaceae bacterium]
MKQQPQTKLLTMHRATLFFFLVFAQFVLGQTLSLEECIALALEKNISIKQASLELENAKVDQSDARSAFLPNVNVQSSHSWNIGLNQNITTGILENLTTQFTSIGGSVGMSLFNGRKNFIQLYRSNLNLLAKEYQLNDMADDVRLLVANAFLQIMFNDEILKVSQTQLELSQSELERTQNLISSGVLPPGDVYEIQATVAAQEQALIQAENNLRLSKISLAQLLLIQDYDNFDIRLEDLEVPFSEIMTKSPKEIYEKALSFRNDIQIANTNVELATTDIKLAKADQLPSLSGFYSYSTRISYSDRRLPSGTFQTQPIGFLESTGERVVTQIPETRIVGPESFFNQWSLYDGHNFGLQLTVPIFNRNAVRNRITRSQINLERFKNQLEQEKLNLENTINQAYTNTKGAFKVYEAAQTTRKARAQSYTNASNRLEAGAINSFEFIQTKQRYEQSVSEAIRAKFDYIFKLKVLEFYFGLPVRLRP